MGARVHGLAPGLTTRLLGVVNRLLSGPVDGATKPIPGAELAPSAGQLVKVLTSLGDRSRRRNLEP